MFNMMIKLFGVFVFGCMIDAFLIPHQEVNIMNGSPQYFEEQINATIECLRRYLRKGNPDKGLPVMDPLILTDEIPIYIDNKYLWTDLRVRDVVVEGLLSFETRFIDLSPMINLNINYHFDKIYARANYEGDINVLGLITYPGEGTLDFELQNVSITSAIQFNMTPPLIDDVDFKIHVGNANITLTGIMNDEEWSHYISVFLSHLIPYLINGFPKEISGAVSPMIRDYYNSKVGHMNFLDFLAVLSDSTCPI